MARVASCPQCDHDLVIPSEATGEAWAKCPECRAFFQVGQATTRDLPAAVLVEASDGELGASAPESDKLSLEPTAEVSIDEVAASATLNEAADSSSQTGDLDLQLDDAPEKPKSGDDLEAAAQRIDEWFRSAKTVSDTPPVGDAESMTNGEPSIDFETNETLDLETKQATDDETAEPAFPSRTNATIDMNADDMDELVGISDFDIDEPADELIKSESSKLADEPSSWDDSERMEDLLGDIQVPSNEEFVAAVTHDEEQMDLEPPADVEERPSINMFADDEAPQVTETAGRPRRKRSLVRLLVPVVLGGLFGSAAAYYALLWLRGPNMDFLNVANYLPAVALPPSFSEPKQIAQVSPPIVPETTAETETPAETDTTAEETAEPTEPQDLAPASDEAAEPMPGETATADADTPPAEGSEPSAEMQAGYVEGETPDGAVEPASAVGDRYATGTETSTTTEPTTDTTTPTDVTAEKPVEDLTVADLEPSSPPEEEASTETAAAETAAIDPLFDEPAPPVTAETVEAIQISGAPTFTAEDLSGSIAAAKSAQPKLVEGNFADGKEVKRAKGGAFAVLADLAQKSLFADGGQAELPMEKDAEELFRTTLADAHTRGEVAQIVPMWIASPNRKHGGVFFGGKVTSHETIGSVVECKVELDNGDTLTVLAPASDAAAIDPSKPVGIVGWILDKPAQQVGGYRGAATEAIWTKQLIPLE